jgi:hypothetical protein
MVQFGVFIQHLWNVDRMVYDGFSMFWSSRIGYSAAAGA